MAHLEWGRQAWQSFDQAAGLEWLETNGLGGWAYGTIGGANTRFYHAVLTASTTPPTERLVLLARLEESIVVDGVRHPLCTNRWATGHTEDAGLAALQRFSLAPFPTWTFMVDDVVVEKRLFMRHGENSTVVRYRVRRGAGRGSVTLELAPLVTCRSIHDTVRANDWPFAQEVLDSASVAVEAFVGAPRLFLAADTGRYETGGEWVYGLHYPYEVLRGEATQEDLYRPGIFRWDCEGAGELTLLASTAPPGVLDGAGWERGERERRSGLLRVAATLSPGSLRADPGNARVKSGSAQVNPGNAQVESGNLQVNPGNLQVESGHHQTDLTPAIQRLVLAADQFIVQRRSTGCATVIAGYPWFTDWGRDTMIALPGLTLATRRYPLARDLLQTFAAHERDGLIPNCFPEEGAEPLYNTADASLWFFEATWQYLASTHDHEFVSREIYPVLKRMAEAHVRGTAFGIALTDDGLLRCGNPHVQVTWMDAKVHDWVVTPRDGKPVEIQALWYNALRALSTLAESFGEPAQAHRYRAHARAVEQAFQRFWNPAAGCLFDLLSDDGTPDPAIRPNQLFALTLSHPLLYGAQAQSVVDVAFRELWTPYGLRSLSPRNPAYIGRYEGNRLKRDATYHQGTVWAWLIGPFIRAYLHAYGRTPERLQHARTLLEPLLGHLSDFGLGSVAEIFDGDPPHTPRGCVAQAWSVAELLWLLREELR